MSAVETNPPMPSRSDSAPNSVPFLRLELKRGRLKAAHLGRRVVVLDTEVRRYLAEASAADRHWR